MTTAAEIGIGVGEGNSLAATGVRRRRAWTASSESSATTAAGDRAVAVIFTAVAGGGTAVTCTDWCRICGTIAAVSCTVGLLSPSVAGLNRAAAVPVGRYGVGHEV